MYTIGCMKNTQYLNFPVVITQDEDGFFAFSPSIPGCHTQGNSYEEAQKSIQEAIELCLEVAEDDPDYKEKIDLDLLTPQKRSAS